MTDWNVIPELKQIVGALLFAAREPVSIETIRKTLRDAAKQYEGPVKDFAQVTDDDLRAAIKQLNEELIRDRIGIHVGEVANGYRLQNDLNCGIWIRQMLEKGRSNRLSKPALETLAIIAYRQPCTRSEIEAVRGVAVDAILKNLMEMQLVKAAGRSELPGRPWLFATTQKFLEYFGIKNVQDLPGIEELRRMEKAQAEARRNEAIERAVNEEQSVPDASVGSEAVTGDVTTLDTDTPGDETDDERPDQAGNSRAEDDASEDENDEAGVEDEFDDDDDEFDDDEDDEYDDEDEDEDFEDEEDESEEKS